MCFSISRFLSPIYLSAFVLLKTLTAWSQEEPPPEEETPQIDERIRWRYFQTSEALTGAYAPGVAHFMGSNVLALEKEGALPRSMSFWNLDNGEKMDSGFLGSKALQVLSYSPSTGDAQILDPRGRIVLVDSNDHCAEPLFLGGIHQSDDFGFLQEGQYLYGITDQLPGDEQRVNLFKKGEKWKSLAIMHFPASSRIVFPRNGNRFAVLSAEEESDLLSSIVRYEVSSESSVPQIDISSLGMIVSSVQDFHVSPSGRYGLIIPKSGGSYVFVDFDAGTFETRSSAEGYVQLKSFSPREDHYAIAYNDAFHVLESETGDSKAELEASIAALILSGIGFSASGEQVVVARGIDEIAIIDLDDLNERELDLSIKDVALLRFTPSGEDILIGTYAGEYLLYALDETTPLRTLSEERSFAAVSLPDSKRILAFTASDRLKEFSTESLEEVSTGISSVPLISKVLGYSPTNRRVLINWSGFQVREVDSFDPVLSSEETSIEAVAMSGNGSSVAYVPSVAFDASSIIRIVDVDTGELKTEILFEERKFIHRIALNQNGTRLYFVERNDSLRYAFHVYRVADGVALSSSSEFDRYVDMTVTEGNGVYIATEYEILKFDEESGDTQLSVRLGHYPDLLDRVRVSPDGNLIAASTRFNRIRLYDLERGESLLASPMGAAPSYAVTGLSPDFDFINNEGDLMVHWESGRLEVLELQEGRMVSFSMAAEDEEVRFALDTGDESRYALNRSESLGSWAERFLFWGSPADQENCSGAIAWDEEQPLFLRVWEFK